MAVVTGSQTTILPVPDGENAFPFLEGYPVNHIALNNKLIEQSNLINNLFNQISLLQEGTTGVGDAVEITMNWAGGSLVTNGDYILQLHTAYDFLITSVDFGVGTTGGSFSFTVEINGTPVTGANLVEVFDSAIHNTSTGANNFVPKGSKLEVIITNVTGAPTDTVISINGVRSAGTGPNILEETAITDSGFTLITDDGIPIEFDVLL